MSTIVFVYEAARDILRIDTEHDTAVAGTNQQHLEAAAATPRHKREQDQARGSRRDGCGEPAGFGPAECTRMMLAPGPAEGAGLRKILTGG